MQPPIPKTHFASPITVIPVILLVLFALPFASWIPDDAFISFEYAQNLADGRGPVFNPGERVEGFSNPLWTLVLAGVAAVGIPLAGAAVALSLAAAIVLVGFLGALFFVSLPQHAPLEQRRFVAAALAVASSLFFPFAFYATSGLETAFYTLCLVVGAFFHIVTARQFSMRPWIISLSAFFAAALTRPEGIGFLLLSTMLFVIGNPDVRRPALSMASIFLLALIAALIGRIAYFGEWVPNTYWAKPGASPAYLTPIPRGSSYLIQFFVRSAAGLLLPFALLRPPAGQRYVWAFMIVLLAYQLFFIVFTGGDVLRFDRFGVPLFPWLFAAAGLGFLKLMQAQRDPVKRFARIAVIGTVTLMSVVSIARAFTAHGKYCEHDWMHAHAHSAVGHMLGEMLDAGDTIVTNEIGAIRFYSRVPVIDMLGLTDDTVAKIRYQSYQEHGVGSSDWSTEAVAAYLLDRNPTCVLLQAPRALNLSNPTRSNMHPLWFAILTEPRFLVRFKPIARLEIHERKNVYVFIALDHGSTITAPAPTKCLAVHTF